ncbi:MAG TPA: hypothetical protein PKC84_18600 [Paracoccaceae bacterium]|nr:hypothetical protein [Paracoccaceae bacterium]
MTYPDAPASLIGRWETRRRRLGLGADETFPPVDPDLAHLAGVPAAPPVALPGDASPHARKVAELRTVLAGHSELAVLNALAIAHLRKRHAPRGTAALFRRIWTEQAPHLIAELPGRWLISSAITFADHGASEGERRLGAELNVLFSLIKLYEFERAQMGFDPAAAHRRRPHPGPLPLGMPPFALAAGGLDINLLAPIWARAEAEPVLGPLACALLQRLNADPGNLFRRLSALRARRRRGSAAEPAPT